MPPLKDSAVSLCADVILVCDTVADTIDLLDCSFCTNMHSTNVLILNVQDNTLHVVCVVLGMFLCS